MKGSTRFRARIGDYRIIYTFDMERNTIHLLAIGHRREIYRATYVFSFDLDHLREATRDAHALDQECLLDARCRETPRLLLRPLWLLQ